MMELYGYLRTRTEAEVSLKKAEFLPSQFRLVGDIDIVHNLTNIFSFIGHSKSFLNMFTAIAYCAP